MRHPCNVITTAVIASLVVDAWPHSLTAVDILNGFKKCGIHPLNPEEVHDRWLAPSEPLCAEKSQPDKEPDNLFTREQKSLYSRDDLKKNMMSTIQAILHGLESIIQTLALRAQYLLWALKSLLLRFIIIRNFRRIAGFTKTWEKSQTERESQCWIINKTVCLTDNEVLEELKTKKKRIAAEETKKAKQFYGNKKRLEKEKKRKRKVYKRRRRRESRQ